MKWDEMTPRERDVFVAQRVMGHEVDVATVRGFTTNISAAWSVVERLKTDYTISIFMHNTAGKFDVYIGTGSAYSTNIAEAICLAALEAMGVKI